jgi:hypothetical protein
MSVTQDLRRKPRNAQQMFYALLTAIPVSAAAALFAFARLIDAANGGRAPVAARLGVIASAVVVAALVLAATATSPLT